MGDLRYLGLVTFDPQKTGDMVLTHSAAYVDKSDASAFVERVTDEANDAGMLQYRGSVLEVRVEGCPDA